MPAARHRYSGGCPDGHAGSKAPHFRKGYGWPRVRNDDVTVAKSTEFNDVIERTGTEVVREAVVKAGDLAGDGTTTATVITCAIVHAGVRRRRQEAGGSGSMRRETADFVA
jgi:chaperonin GroEL